ncbi:hypothetical protein [Parafrankia sp. BMG5.11]|uniref:hypothetical protein n=1 Tax=Parafrankia sp. BMG5.11 TaxID=222540 RepID=UPI00103B96AE|nr:hypothetical protein [Parafrankia sp. BMG5.11]TCJ31758.1 hypothetical protein E0504_46625 [Parafrankia sp. BMG5.11]
MWTVLDQVASSGTNAAINFVIARRVSATEFGAFAIAYTIFALVMGLSRAASTTPLGIHYATASPPTFRVAARAASGTALTLGVLSGAVLLAAGTASTGALGSNLVAMGIVMPALLVQDSWRYTFFAEGRPAAALANDLVWATTMVAAFAALPARFSSDAACLVLAWGAAAVVAALLGIAQTRAWPDPRRAIRWFTAHRETTGFMTAEYVTVQGAQQTSTLIIGMFGSSSLVGALRGIQTLLAPTTNLAVALTSFAIPEFARRPDMPLRTRSRLAYALSAVVVASSTIWALVFLVLPDGFGRALLGDTWLQTRGLLGLAIVQQAGPALAVGPAAVLYALGRTRLTFRINLRFAPLLLACPLIGLHLGGAKGVIVGYIIAFWSTIPTWIIQLRRQTRP